MAPFSGTFVLLLSIFCAVSFKNAVSGDCAFPASYTNRFWFRMYSDSSYQKFFYRMFTTNLVDNRNDNASTFSQAYSCSSLVLDANDPNSLYYVYDIPGTKTCVKSVMTSDNATILVQEVYVNSNIADAGQCIPLFTAGSNGALWTPVVTSLSEPPPFGSSSPCPFPGVYQLTAGLSGSASECSGNGQSTAVFYGSNAQMNLCQQGALWNTTFRSKTLLQDPLMCMASLDGRALNSDAAGSTIVLLRDSNAIYCARFRNVSGGLEVLINVKATDLFAGCSFNSSTSDSLLQLNLIPITSTPGLTTPLSTTTSLPTSIPTISRPTPTMSTTLPTTSTTSSASTSTTTRPPTSTTTTTIILLPTTSTTSTTLPTTSTTSSTSTSTTTRPPTSTTTTILLLPTTSTTSTTTIPTTRTSSINPTTPTPNPGSSTVPNTGTTIPNTATTTPSTNTATVPTIVSAGGSVSMVTPGSIPSTSPGVWTPTQGGSSQSPPVNVEGPTDGCPATPCAAPANCDAATGNCSCPSVFYAYSRNSSTGGCVQDDRAIDDTFLKIVVPIIATAVAGSLIAALALCFAAQPFGGAALAAADGGAFPSAAGPFAAADLQEKPVYVSYGANNTYANAEDTIDRTLVTYGDRPTVAPPVPPSNYVMVGSSIPPKM